MKWSSWRPVVLGAMAGVGLYAWLVPSTETASRDWRRAQYRDRAEVFVAANAWLDARRSAARLELAWERLDSRERGHAVATTYAASGNGSGMVIGTGPGVPAGTRERIVRTAYVELTGIGAPVPRHPIAIAIFVDTAQQYARYRRAVVLPATPDAPCTVVVRLSAPTVEWAEIAVTDRLLGTCAFYAAYGTPGAGMRSWLVRSGMRSATYLQPPAALGDDSALVEVSESTVMGNPDLVACRAGRAEGCRRVFDAVAAIETERDEFGMERPVAPIAPTPDALVLESNQFTAARRNIRAGMLAALATTLGPDAFARVWRSDLAPEAAFESQTGRPLTSWLGEYVATRMEPYHAGPGLRALPFALALILIGVATALAFTLPRRQMG